MILTLGIKINGDIKPLEVNDSEFVFDIIERVIKLFKIRDVRHNGKHDRSYQLSVIRSGVVLPINDELRLHVTDGDILSLEVVIVPQKTPV